MRDNTSARRWLWWPLALSACTSTCQDPTPAPAHVDADVDDAYTVEPDRFVVRLLQPGPCPAPDPGWSVARLFEDADTMGILAQYCAYDKVDATAGPGPFATIRGRVIDPERVANGAGFGNHDRLGLSVTAIDVDALNNTFYDRFLFGAGGTTLGPTPAEVAGVAVRPTVVILDTAPDSASPWPGSVDPFRGPQGHGQWLAAMARALTCPEGVGCPVGLETRQVIGRAATSLGGRAGPGDGWGTLSDLARGIVRAVKAWKDRGGRASGPLVLNMSVAWHPYHGGGAPGLYEIGAEGATVPGKPAGVFRWADVQPEQFPPDVRAVYEALAYARCAGALSFAAVGNATAGPFGGSGPMLPAGWEGLPPASLPACPQFMMEGAAPSAAAPLVVAVGAVDAQDAPIPVTRPDSLPLLVADGDHARSDAGSSKQGDPSPTLTGTSVSTLVVSAAAAAMWSTRPDATPEEILRGLTALAQPVTPASGWSAVGLARDLGVAAPIQARRVRVCEAMGGARACARAALASVGDVGLAGLTPAVTGTWPGPAGSDPACADGRLYRSATATTPPAADPCPSKQYFGPALSPWLGTQPGPEMCTECLLDLRSGKLFIKHPSLPKAQAIAVRVTTPNATYTFSVPASAIPTASDTMTLGFEPVALGASAIAASQATLDIKIDDRAVIAGLYLQ